MALRKERAIEIANKRAAETKRKQYVIASPDTYNDIFDNTQYKMLEKIEEEERFSIVYETK